ncbi:MAG: hypothetical protein HOO67_04135 [Candidatus Peribacteraceae bacterium]|nr:hypothetical protein [Candidatus Peribacteraceae bacterium]
MSAFDNQRAESDESFVGDIRKKAAAEIQEEEEKVKKDLQRLQAEIKAKDRPQQVADRLTLNQEQDSPALLLVLRSAMGAQPPAFVQPLPEDIRKGHSDLQTRYEQQNKSRETAEENRKEIVSRTETFLDPETPVLPVFRKGMIDRLRTHQKLLTEAEETRKTYERLRQEMVERELQKGLGLERDTQMPNNPPIAAVQFQELLEQFSRQVPLPNTSTVYEQLSGPTRTKMRDERTDLEDRREGIVKQLAEMRRILSGEAQLPAGEQRSTRMQRLQENMAVFLLRLEAYSGDLGFTRPPLSRATEFIIFMCIAAGRIPVDQMIDRPENRPPLREILNPKQLEELRVRRQDLVKRLEARGVNVRNLPDWPELFRVMEASPFREFFRDLVRVNALDALLFAYCMHTSTDKVRTALQFGASIVACAGMNSLLFLSLQKSLLIAAARLPGLSGRAVLWLSKIPGNFVIKFAVIAIALYFFHNQVEAAVEEIDRLTYFLPSGWRETLAKGLDVVSGGPLVAQARDGLEVLGVNTVDPERGRMDYLGRESLMINSDGGAGSRLTVMIPLASVGFTYGYSNSMEDWNTRVEQAIKAEPNPLIKNLWQLERIDNAGSNWSALESVNLMRNVGTLNLLQTQLAEELLKDPPMVLTQATKSQLNLLELATIDSGDPNSAQLTAALRQVTVVRAVKDHIAALVVQPGNGEAANERIGKLKDLWRSYERIAERIARDVSVYRSLGLYPNNQGRRQWLGNLAVIGTPEYAYSQQVQNGFVEELAFTMRVQQCLRFDPAGDMTAETFAVNLAAAVRGSRDPQDLRNLVDQTFNLNLLAERASKTKRDREAELKDTVLRSQMQHRLDVQCRDIAAFFPDARTNPEQAAEFNRLLEPVRHLVMQYRHQGQPNGKQMLALTSQLEKTLKDLYLRAPTVTPIRYTFFSNTPSTLNIPMYRVGPVNDLLIRGFTTTISNIHAENYRPDPATAPYTDLIVFQTSLHGCAMISFSIDSPDRTQWRVRRSYSNRTFGGLRGDGFADPIPLQQIQPSGREELTFTAWANNPANAAALLAIEVELKTLEAREKKNQDATTKAKLEKMAQEEREKKETADRAAIAEMTTNRFIMVRPGDILNRNIEYRMRHNDMTVVYVTSKYAAPYDSVTNWRLPVTVSQNGGYAIGPQMFNVTHQPGATATVTFQFRNPDGTEARAPISVASYAAYSQLPDDTRLLFHRLLTTPMENDEQTLFRMVRLFPYRYEHNYWTSGIRYMNDDCLVARLLPLYEASNRKSTFLADLFSKLRNMNQSTGLNEATVNTIVQFFEKQQSGGTTMEPIFVRGPQYLGSEMHVVQYRYRPGQTRSFDRITGNYGNPPGSAIEGYLSAANKTLWREPFRIRDQVLQDIPNVANLLAVTLPPSGEFEASVESRIMYNGLRNVFNESAQQLKKTSPQWLALINRQREVAERVAGECSLRPPRLSAETRTVAQEYLKTVSQYVREVHTAQRRMELVPVVLAALRPRLQELQRLQTLGLSSEERNRYGLYNPEEEKLINALSRPSLSSYDLLIAAVTASADGQEVAGVITNRIAAHEKQYPGYLKRVESYRKGRETRFKQTAETRAAVLKESPASGAYRPLNPLEAATALGGRTHRPTLLWKGDRTPQDLTAFQNVVDYVGGFQFTNLPWNRLGAVIMDVTGTGDGKRYMITLCYRGPGSGGTGGISIPSAEFTTQLSANWTGTPPQLAKSPMEFVLAGSTPDPYRDSVVQAVRTQFENQQKMDVSRLGVAPEQGGMSAAESFARVLEAPGNTMRITRLPGQDQTVMSFMRNGRQFLVRRNATTQQWEFRVAPLRSPAALVVQAGNTAVPRQASEIQQEIGQQMIDSLIKAGGDFGTGWQSVNGAMSRISQTPQNTPLDLDIWSNFQAMGAGSLEHGFGTETAGFFVATRSHLLPQGQEMQMQAALEQGLQNLGSSPELQALLMQQMQKFFSGRSSPLAAEDVSMLNTRLRQIGQGGQGVVTGGQGGPILADNVLSLDAPPPVPGLPPSSVQNQGNDTTTPIQPN